MFQNTALHYAAANGCERAVELLLDKHADNTRKNNNEETALDVAISNLHNKVACTMLEHRT